MRTRTYLITVVLAALLTSCAEPLTYADAQATAIVAGCWPGNGATPRALTVTPFGGSTATRAPAAPATTRLGTPTVTPPPTTTRLPTTTPYPRCTPGPGEPTLRPFPTPAPPRPPYPTQEPKLRQGGSDEQTTLLLPGRVYAIDLAVHPTEGWPVIGVMQRFSLSTDPIQSFARVFNPRTRSWGPAQQLDVGASSNGMDRNGSTVVGVTGDGIVHAAWGGSDEQPEGGLWMSSSADYGVSWSAPELLADSCALALDMASSAGGWIVVLAQCYERTSVGVRSFAGVLVREPGGAWRSLDRLAAPATFGAVVIVGDGDTARAVALTTAHGSQGDVRTLYITSKRLAATSGWTIQTRPFAVSGIEPAELGDFGINVQGLTYTRPGQDRPGITFLFSGRKVASAYTLTSPDSGDHWGPVAAVAFFRDGRTLEYVSGAYDAAADRLIALWVMGSASEATHYARWSVPGSSVWEPLGDAQLIPLVLGARQAQASTSAQAANGRVAWVAWVEGEKQIEVRSLNLNQVVPISAYPTVTPPPTTAASTTGGQP